MQRREPLKEILKELRSVWDRDGVRPSIRRNFAKVLMCRTGELGSEVYASDSEQLVVHHTCKSRACPSCGHRATRLWQRKMRASLPDVDFAGVVFTMPDVLWPIFRRNRHLADDLAALGAAVISQWAKETSGIVPMIMVVRHTFGRHLNFNPHLHILVSSGGFGVGSEEWRTGVPLEKYALMKRWRYALVTYLREALRHGLIYADRDSRKLRSLLTAQYERWWNVGIQPCASKEHFLRYAGRYVRRPPLAQYRILAHTPAEVRFRTEDHKLKKEVTTAYTGAAFIDLLGEHVPDHYKHSVRHFGVLSPRSRSRITGALFAQLGQMRQENPQHLSWSESIEREFGVNPLRDSRGQRMRLVARRPPLGTALR